MRKELRGNNQIKCQGRIVGAIPVCSPLVNQHVEAGELIEN